MNKREAATELGEALTRLWRQAGEPSVRSIERALVIDLGADLAPSNEQLRRMLSGQVSPYICSVESLIGLTRYFHVGPGDLGDAASHRLHTLLDYLSESPDRQSGWVPGSPLRRFRLALDGDIAQLSLFGGAEPVLSDPEATNRALCSIPGNDRRHHRVPVAIDRRHHDLGIAA